MRVSQRVLVGGFAALVVGVLLSLTTASVTFADDGGHNHKPKKVETHGDDQHHAQPQALPQSTAHKVGVCHRTGSDNNPFVFIMVDEHAVEAHRGHGDAVGVHSAADCNTHAERHDDDHQPVVSEQHMPPSVGDELHPEVHQAVENHKVGICHATGADGNPFVFISVDDNAVEAHRAHGDVIGFNSQADCPTHQDDHSAPQSNTQPLTSVPTDVTPTIGNAAGVGVSAGKLQSFEGSSASKQ